MAESRDRPREERGREGDIPSQDEDHKGTAEAVLPAYSLLLRSLRNTREEATPKRKKCRMMRDDQEQEGEMERESYPSQAPPGGDGSPGLTGDADCPSTLEAEEVAPERSTDDEEEDRGKTFVG